MKYLTYHLTSLLLWLSVLTWGAAARATEAGFLTATPTPVTLPVPGGTPTAPIGAQETQNLELPPPPPVENYPAVPLSDIPTEASPIARNAPIARNDIGKSTIPDPSSPPDSLPGTRSGGTLDFALTPTSRSSRPPESPDSLPSASASPPPAAPLTAAPALDVLFAGNENSVVAKAVGSAEGTRTPDGERNPAYYGHTDPGNGVWNLGSFSYQHTATSPEDADAKQLARLRKQADQILQKANDKGLSLSIAEKLNGIDLANQAPMAALGRQGYVDWLAVAKSEGKPEADAVLSARVRSFINPKTQQWDAPGLGNSEDRITRDQARRMQAIDRAILANQQQIAQLQQPTAGEEQLLSQAGESLFSGAMPSLLPEMPPETLPEMTAGEPTAGGGGIREPIAEKTIAEAANTDSIIRLDRL